jgi:hypothetical protein
VSIDGGGPGGPTPVADYGLGVYGLDVSPDGTLIVMRHLDGGLTICALPDCSDPRPLPPVTGGTGGTRVRWTPDGGGIAYAEPDATNLWVQPIDGSAATQLTHFSDPRPIADFRWSRDGERLAIVRASVSSDIVLFTALRR